MNGTSYEVPHCGAFSTPHSHPSWAQIFASGSCFQTEGPYTSHILSSSEGDNLVQVSSWEMKQQGTEPGFMSIDAVYGINTSNSLKGINEFTVVAILSIKKRKLNFYSEW